MKPSRCAEGCGFESRRPLQIPHPTIPSKSKKSILCVDTIASAGVTLVKGDLRGIVRACRLSRAIVNNIKQNLFFAFVYNALGVPIAAGVLYPFFSLLLNPMIAAAALSFSSVSVIGNALRLRRVNL